MEGSVLSFLKAEWKVSDTGSAHWASSLLFQSIQKKWEAQRSQKGCCLFLIFFSEITGVVGMFTGWISKKFIYK
jgi:hypothetical protein